MLAAGFGQGLTEGYKQGQELKLKREQLEMQKEYYKAQSQQATSAAKLHDIETAVKKRSLRQQMELMGQAGTMDPESALFGSPLTKPTGLGETMRQTYQDVPAQGPGAPIQSSLLASIDPTAPRSMQGPITIEGPQPTAQIPTGSPETFTAGPQAPYQQMLAGFSPDDQAMLQSLAAVEGPGRALEKMLTLRNPTKTQHVISPGGALVDPAGKVLYAAEPRDEKVQTTASANDVALELFDKPFKELTKTERATVKQTQQDRELAVAGAKATSQKEAQLEMAAPIAEAQAKARLKVEYGKEIADLDNVNILLDQIGGLADKLITADSGPAAIVQGAKLRTGALTRTNDAAKAYQDQQQAFLGVISRQLGGERGVLTDRDITRISGALPEFFDTKTVKDYKLGAMRLVLKTAVDARKRAISGDPPDPAIRQHMEQMLDSLDKSTKAIKSVSPKSGEAQAAPPRSLSTMTKEDQKVLSVFGDLDAFEADAVMKGWGLGRSAEEISEQIRTHRADKGRRH